VNGSKFNDKEVLHDQREEFSAYEMDVSVSRGVDIEVSKKETVRGNKKRIRTGAEGIGQA
jgi:hypothetical protein